MYLMNSKLDKKAESTTLYLSNGKVGAALDSKLSDYDHQMLISLIEMAHNAGISAGREEKAAEFRSVLGL